MSEKEIYSNPVDLTSKEVYKKLFKNMSEIVEILLDNFLNQIDYMIDKAENHYLREYLYNLRKKYRKIKGKV